MRAAIRILAWVGISASVAVGSASSPESVPELSSDTALLSTTRRFMAVGPDAAQNLQSLLFAEEAAARLERTLRAALPTQPGNPIQIIFSAHDALEEPLIARQRIWMSDRILQRILVVNPDRSDPEDFLEALMAELLDRYLWARHPPRRGTAPATAPEWVAIGLAQNLYPALRARNHTLLRRHAFRGHADDLVLAQQPPGSPGPTTPTPYVRALRGTVFAWLKSRPRYTEHLHQWLRRWAESSSVTLEDMLADTGISREAVDLEWNLWLAAQASVLRPREYADLADLQNLQERLRIPAPAIPGAQASRERWITPTVVVRHRNEPWAQTGAQMLRNRLSRLGSGAWGESFHEVVTAFIDVLSAVESPPRRRPWRKPSAAPLIERLRNAHRLLDALESDANERVRTEHDPNMYGRPRIPVSEDAREHLRRHLDHGEKTNRGIDEPSREIIPHKAANTPLP